LEIRIWHHNFTVLSDLAAYGEALKDDFLRVSRWRSSKSQGTEFRDHGHRPSSRARISQRALSFSLARNCSTIRARVSSEFAP